MIQPDWMLFLHTFNTCSSYWSTKIPPVAIPSKSDSYNFRRKKKWVKRYIIQWGQDNSEREKQIVTIYIS